MSRAKQEIESGKQLRRLPKVRAGPDGVHIFDRSTGANILLDELKSPPELWALAPRHMAIALTNACDLRCPFCYAPKHNAVLNPDRLLKWLDELDANGCLGVGFGGGEPTLHPQFSQICRTTASSTSLAVSFTTHAHHVDAALADELKGSVHFVRISMDGCGSTYERLRGKSFSAFLNHVQVVRKISPFGVNYVVNATTLPELDEAIAIACDLDATEFLLLPQQPVGVKQGITSEVHVALREWIESYRGSLPLRISEQSAAGLPTCEAFPNEGGLRAYAHIDASGMLKHSSFDTVGVNVVPDGIINALELLRLSERDGK